MKVMKLVVKVLALVVALVVAAVAALPLWFGPVVKTAANSAVPGLVKADFSLRHLSLNPYTARFELGDLNLGNPQGYSVKDAGKVGSVTFDAETLSLMTDVIHVEELTVKDVFVSVVSGGENNTLNFKQLQYNVAGGKEKYEAAQSEKEAKAAAEQDSPSARESGEEKPAKKIIIDRLEISGLSMQLSILPIRVPVAIVLTDIGKKTGGATFEEAWNQILDGVMKSAGVAGDQLKALGVLSGDAVKKANEAVSKVSAQATAVMGDAAKKLSATTEKATAVMDDATKGLSAGAAKTTSAVSSTVGVATDAASGVVNGGAKAVDSSVKAVGDGAKAVGEGAKKAMDSLKSLW